MSNARLDGVDLLRALAMTGVLAQHSGIFPAGWTGVWLFYVISGFVITRGFVSRPMSPGGSKWSAYGRFMLARMARILPALFVYLAICGVVAWSTGVRGYLEHLPHLAASVFNWRMISLDWSTQTVWGPLGHLWTISVEQQFYLVFPLIALALPGAWRIRVIVALLVLAPLLRLFTGWWLGDGLAPLDKAFAIYASTHGHIDAFLAGALLAYQWDAWRDDAQLRRRWGFLALGVALSYAVVYAGVHWSQGARGVDLIRNLYSGILYGQGREVWVYAAVVCVATWMVWTAAAAGAAAPAPKRGATGLAMRCTAWIGRVSYSGYLYHGLVLWMVGTWILQPAGWPGGAIGKLTTFALALPLTLLLAAASYRWVEQPGVAWAARWAGRGPARQGASSPTSPLQPMGARAQGQGQFQAPAQTPAGLSAPGPSAKAPPSGGPRAA